MKRYLIPILVFILMLTSGLSVGCGDYERDQAGGESERDKALAFYKALNLIYSEIMDNMGEWNEWSRSASQLEFERDVQKKCNRFESTFKNLHNNLITLSAPDRLMELKDTLAQATDKAAESFAMTRQYANTRSETHLSKALQALNEYNRLMVVASHQWDDGLTYYKIELLEILP